MVQLLPLNEEEPLKKEINKRRRVTVPKKKKGHVMVKKEERGKCVQCVNTAKEKRIKSVNNLFCTYSYCATCDAFIHEKCWTLHCS